MQTDERHDRSCRAQNSDRGRSSGDSSCSAQARWLPAALAAKIHLRLRTNGPGGRRSSSPGPIRMMLISSGRCVRDSRSSASIPAWVSGKSVLLKPNLVEPSRQSPHINTHPALVCATAEVFRSLGAREVFVAEGQGHCRDSDWVLDESGLGRALAEAKLPFVDLNHEDVFFTANRLRFTSLGRFGLPEALKRADIIVSMPKLKTHHWVGATLSMKNLFGVMPGVYYGWPKNVLHYAGINEVDPRHHGDGPSAPRDRRRHRRHGGRRPDHGDRQDCSARS